MPAVGVTDQSAAPGAPGRIGARVAFVVVGVALLALAAWSASRAAGTDSSPDLPGNPGDNTAILNDSLLIAAGAAAAALLIYMAPILRQGRGPKRAVDEELPRPALWLRLLTGALVILATVAAVLVLTRNRQESTQPLPEAPPTTVQNQQVEPTEGAGARGWAALTLFGVGALVVVIGVVWWQRRGRARGEYSLDDEFMSIQHVVEPLDLEALDPHDAIRTAYAAARRAVSSLGVAARAAETPYEFLDRVRATAPAVQRPVATLTRLFEIARFSHHPLTTEMKTEAVEAYGAVMAEVAHVREAMVLS